MPEPFQAFLLRSMDLLEREKPALHARLEAMLVQKELELVIDEVPLSLRFAPTMTVLDDPTAPDIRLRSNTAVILAVMDGELSLEDAVLNDHIVLVGALRDLVLFHEALLLYLHGAVRAPSFPALFAAYRVGVGGTDRPGPSDARLAGSSRTRSYFNHDHTDSRIEGEDDGRPY